MPSHPTQSTLDSHWASGIKGHVTAKSTFTPQLRAENGKRPPERARAGRRQQQHVPTQHWDVVPREGTRLGRTLSPVTGGHTRVPGPHASHTQPPATSTRTRHPSDGSLTHLLPSCAVHLFAQRPGPRRSSVATGAEMLGRYPLRTRVVGVSRPLAFALGRRRRSGRGRHAPA